MTTLLPMIEKRKESLDSGGIFGALLIGVSKVFDCLPHDLLIAKLHAYGLDMPSLKLLHSYLTKRRQRFKINKDYSSWNETVFRVPQRAILDQHSHLIYFCVTCFFLYPTLVWQTMLMTILFTPPINILVLY